MLKQHASRDMIDAQAIASSIHEHPSQNIPGVVAAFRFDADGTAEELAIDAPIVGRPDGWLWLHFNLADARACHFLMTAPYFPMQAMALLTAADEHQQLHVAEDCLYGVFADFVCGLEGVTEEIGFLHFAMTEKLLVSGRRRQLNAVEAIRKAIRKGRKIPTPAAVVDAIVEQVVDAVDHYTDSFARELDRIEEKIHTDEASKDRSAIGRIRRTTVRLHRQLVNLRTLMQRFGLNLGSSAKPGLKLETAKLTQRLDWLDTEIIALRDRAQLLQEEVTIKTAEQTNRNLHLLAVVTTIFMPATLVTGIFGMNVEGLPFTQTPNGFVWSMLILAGASAFVFWLLKRSGILRR